MSILIEQIPQIQFRAANQTTPQKDDTLKKNLISPKIVMGTLAAVGATTLAVLAIKNKKKPNVGKVEQIIGKNPKTQNLTEIEKEKLIKELQAQTDNQEVKEEIRKLIENGEWDKL